MYICMYVCMYVCMCVYIHIYIYIDTHYVTLRYVILYSFVSYGGCRARSNCRAGGGGGYVMI